MVGWHHWLNGHEFEQAPGVGEGQGSLVCCSPRVTESDTTEWLIQKHACSFSSSHVWMWALDHKEGWVQKNWCFQSLVVKTLESPLDSKEFKPVNPKGNKTWILIGRTDAEAVAPILWPPVEKSWLIGKDSDAGKGWGQEEKQATEDEMTGWHHWYNGHEFEQTMWDSKGQGNLVCCSSWGHKELDTT